MAGSTTPIFTAVANNGVQQFANADGTTKKTLFTPGANGSRIDRILVTSNDTAAVTLQVYVTVSAVNYHLVDVTIPIGTGYTTVVAMDILPTVLRSLGGSLTLPTAHVLKGAALAAVTAAQVVDVVCVGGDY